jgi:hypothetical protein
MNELLIKRMHELGVPIPKTEISNLTWNHNLFVNFMNNNINLLILNQQYYHICAKLMKLKLIQNIGINIGWFAQSVIEKIEDVDVDIVVILQLYKEPSEYRKRLPGALMHKILNNGGQVIIGAHSSDEMEQSFLYDLDTIEERFEIWK